ncbi:hypothetical protein [Hyphomonas sp.]|uniref:hypothetical protein n=1 Tax=Hyphomonas sp. TaxID=87 RepID=UPI0025BAD0EB|nr:hypothetical protein [Hyphomonas sp.]
MTAFGEIERSMHVCKMSQVLLAFADVFPSARKFVDAKLPLVWFLVEICIKQYGSKSFDVFGFYPHPFFS